jgi:hypothetical protein
MQIEYIFLEDLDMNDPNLRKIQEYCEMRNIPFKTRLFDSTEYEEDGLFITKLPAIHIYYKKQYYDTYFTDGRPIREIQLVYSKFELEEMEYLSKKQIWDEKLKHIKWLFHRRSLKTDSQVTKKTV